ncbi:MAG: fasciclin domain-containing protein [Cyanobacteriota bacterium]|nr:fasciclin domain-containing protein [Cyanobacteriota bacterium]
MSIFQRFKGFQAAAVVGLIATSTLLGLVEPINAGGPPHRGSRNSGQAQAAAGDIVETATSAGQFTILAQALEAAGLIETLKGNGPFTVFAPTDAAFRAFPEGTLEDLLKPENRDQLVAILTYHVVPGRVTSDELESGEVKTVQGSAVTVKVGSDVMVDEAKVVTPDISASNGVIHVIDKVILPE